MNYCGNYNLTEILPQHVKDQINKAVKEYLKDINAGYNIFKGKVSLGELTVYCVEEKDVKSI